MALKLSHLHSSLKSFPCWAAVGRWPIAGCWSVPTSLEDHKELVQIEESKLAHDHVVHWKFYFLFERFRYRVCEWSCKDLTDMKYRSNRRFLATISTFVTIPYIPKGQLWLSSSQSFQRQHVLNFHIVSRRSSQHFILFLVAPKSSTKASNNHSFSASISVLSFVTPL